MNGGILAQGQLVGHHFALLPPSRAPPAVLSCSLFVRPDVIRMFDVARADFLERMCVMLKRKGEGF